MPSKLSRRSDFEQNEWLNIHERMQMDQTNDKLFQQVVQTKQPLFVEDVAKENRIFQEICDVFNIKSIFMVPMISVGRVLGVIVVAHLGEQPAEYTKAQQRRVESIVNATAPVLIHLYNLESQESIIARRTEEIQSKNEELQRLILEMRKINTEKELIMNTVDEGIIGFSLEGTVMFSNEAAEHMLETDTQLFHSIQSYDEILEHVENEEGALSDIFASYLASDAVQPVSGEAYMSHPEKGLVTLEYTLSSQIEEGIVVGYVLTVRDVTVRKEMEQRIEYYAYYDGTTGLPNRMLVHDRLSQTLREAKEHDQEIAVLFLDLDRFKQINDRFGHAGGDELLTEVAYRLQEMVSGAATVARQGGDEFILILPRLDSMAQATSTAEQILRVFRNPFYLEGEEVYVKPSIGISFFPLDGHLADDLIQNANSAMHKAKEMNGNTYRAFSSEQMGPDMKKIRLENDLYRALENNELELFYQPQVRLSKNIVIGVEALVRWNHPLHGKIAPSDFIPIAEDTGLITSIGEWILEEACSQAKNWQEQSHCSLRVAVNISAQQFQREGLVDTVKEVLARTGLAPEFLEIEITENTLLLNTEETVTTMKRLKSIGVRISIDDFGTGYCSLQYLREFPIDTLKIDKVFIDDIKSENSSAPITTTIIALAHSLNLHVIAEGVETLEQQKFLQANNCDLVQGFLYSKPVQAGKIPGFCNN
jgi:diguanylate cyclase (GGDEF)-like protein